MKVAVITRHAILNYGSLLQTIATQSAIEKLEFECEIIDYIKQQEGYREIEKNLVKKKKRWNRNFITRSIYLLIRQPESVYAGIKFEKERRKYLNLSERYTSSEQLKQKPPKAAIYLTGSDQVWGPVGDAPYDEVYTLSFVEGKKVAYAASFGRAMLDDQVKQFYKKEISKYACVSVREESAIAILNELGIDALQVLDPTLLFDFGFWKQYMQPIQEKKYVLVYQIHQNSTLDNYAKKVAKHKGIPLIRVSAYMHQAMRTGKLVLCPEIGKFLSYIQNAECLVTDSFHGTAFAINFNVQFVDVLKYNDTETRNMSILNLMGLTDRILKDEENVELTDQKIDFSNVNSILEAERKKSWDILKKMIGK